MKLSDSLKGIVSKTIINNVLEGVQHIDLEVLSSTPAAAQAKLGSNLFPTIDSGLIDGHSGSLYSKSNQNTAIVLPKKQARQIARSVAVVKGDLPVTEEHDSDIYWANDSRVSKIVMFEDVIQMGEFVYLVDINLNNGDVINLSTYSRDFFVPNLYYGHKDFNENVGTTYFSEATILSLGSEIESMEQRIDDGSTTGTLTLPDTVAGIVEAAQTSKLTNATIRIRLAIVRNTKITFGPIRLTSVKADKVTHSVDVKEKKSIVAINLIKSWDTITNRYGMIAAYADHLSRFPTDNFMRYTSNTQQAFTWKLK